MCPPWRAGQRHAPAAPEHAAGEGTGGAVAYHLLRCAVNIFNEMATFAEAQVDEGL